MKQLKRDSAKVKPDKYYTSFACETIDGDVMHSRVFTVNKATTFKELKENVIKSVGVHHMKKAVEENDISIMLAFTLDKDLFREILDITCWEFDTRDEAISFQESEEKRIEEQQKSKLN